MSTRYNTFTQDGQFVVKIRVDVIYLLTPLPPWWLLLGSTMIMDPCTSKQHLGLQHAVGQLHQDVARPKARFKPTSTGKSWVDGGAPVKTSYHTKMENGTGVFGCVGLNLAIFQLSSWGLFASVWPGVASAFTYWPILNWFLTYNEDMRTLLEPCLPSLFWRQAF